MDFRRRAARKSRIERIRNTEIRSTMHAERAIMDEIEHRRLKWYGHLRRMKDERISKVVHTWKIQRRNRRGRPRATWDYNVQQTMRTFGVTDQDTEEREQWRNLINPYSAKGLGDLLYATLHKMPGEVGYSFCLFLKS